MDLKIIFSNILALILGVLVGAFINGILVNIGQGIFPIPKEIHLKEINDYVNTMPKIKAKHFITPFIAHALGTFFGAFVTFRFAKIHKLLLAILVGLAFFIGGVIMVYILPGTPLWFVLIDLILAYFPMAILGAKLSSLLVPKKIS